MDGCQLAFWDNENYQESLILLEKEISLVLDWLGDWEQWQEQWFDRVTGAILGIYTYDDFCRVIDSIYKKYQDRITYESIRNYAGHRFVNHLGHTGCYLIFRSHARCTVEPNKKHTDRDLWIDYNYPFDLKHTRPFKNFRKLHFVQREQLLNEWVKNPKPLIEEYYKKQSSGRWNWQNRLFVVNYDLQTNQYSYLTYDFNKLYKVIYDYLDNFDPSRLVSVSQVEVNKKTKDINSNRKRTQLTAMSDIVWNVVA